ncbi:MAG: flagellar biosynthetic protein FliR [Lachnospiraceae bacterium]|jgi:flagellar biosynthetic protein FliR|nr:flagellar biosynthetic protein FliR [Lachnospiraceae bacterium]
MVQYSFNIATFEYYVLILVRITSFMVVAPFYGISSAPGRVKIGFSAMISLWLYQVILPKTGLTYSGVFDYSALVLKEVMVGLLIGYAGNICNTIILTAGKLIDMNIGLSMATEYDPMTRTQASVVANMYNYFVLILLIVTNMHHYILRAVCDSFTLIPLGRVNFHMDYLLKSMIQFMSDTFVIAFRIFLPVFAVTMILNVILGILSKVAPQMNMFSVGMQIKLLVGLGVMFVTVFLLPDIANYIFREMKVITVLFIKGMT